MIYIAFKNTVIPLSQVTLGSVVQVKEDVGHIVGFRRNSHDEITIKVRWSKLELVGEDYERVIHPANVIFLQPGII